MFELRSVSVGYGERAVLQGVSFTAQTGRITALVGQMCIRDRGHPEAGTLREDVENLRYKQEAGAEHLITQLFFDNMHFYRFLNLARRAGITLPVSAGVMPIVRRSQIERTVALSSASLPSEFTRMISRWQDDPASLYDAGIRCV